MTEVREVHSTAQSLGNSLALALFMDDATLTVAQKAEALLCLAALLAQKAAKYGTPRSQLIAMLDVACDANKVKL